MRVKVSVGTGVMLELEGGIVVVSIVVGRGIVEEAGGFEVVEGIVEVVLVVVDGVDGTAVVSGVVEVRVVVVSPAVVEVVGVDTGTVVVCGVMVIPVVGGVVAGVVPEGAPQPATNRHNAATSAVLIFFNCIYLSIQPRHRNLHG